MNGRMAPPPPVTPSPHRFVIKKQAPVRKPPLPPSTQLQQTPHPSTQQFNATPRFHFSSAPKPTPTQSSLPRATPSAAQYLTPAPKQQHDAIDELSDDLPGDIHDSIETDGHGLDDENEFSDEEDDYNIEEPLPKRRRLSIFSITSQDEEQDQQNDDTNLEPTSSVPILSSPPTAAVKRLSTIAPKFLPPAPLTPSTPAATPGTTFVKPPRFRPPDPAEQAETTDPLPEHFSPHRKGQKYIHGGLASEVQGWLVNLESAVPVHASSSRVDEKSQWLVRLVVDEVSGSPKTGFTMVKGRQIHAVDGDERGMVNMVGEVKVLLAGEGQVVGLPKVSKVEAGSRIGIKGPVWEIIVEEERWGVGVDWKVLS